MVEAQEGNQVSYKVLLKEISDFLKPILRFKLSNPVDVDDLLQDVLMSVHRSRHTFDPRYPFKPWLKVITQSRLIEFWRKRGKKQSIEVAAEESDIDNLEADSEVSRMEVEQLNEVLEQLSQTQRSIFIKLKIEGLSIKEVASKMKMTESAIKVSAHRAYKFILANIGDTT